MKCPKCGMTVPDDSDFCQYCGFKIDIQRCSRCGTQLKDGAFCPNCGFRNPQFVVTDNKPKVCVKDSVPQKKKISRREIASWGCTLVLAILLVFVGINYANCKTTLEMQLAEMEQLSAENEANKDALSEAENQYLEEHKNFEKYKSSVSEEVRTYRTIKANKNRLEGYSDFYASTYLLVLNKNESKTIYITYTHPYSTVYSDYGTWGKNWNGNTTSITFKGLSHEGVQVCTFSNDTNNETFCVLIVTV